MEAEIFKLLCEYSYKGLLVDEKYIQKLIKIVRRHRKLRKTIKKTKIQPKYIDPFAPKNDAISTYEHNKKLITVYSYGITEFLKMSEEFDHLFAGVERIMYKNSLITQAVLHELEHAEQKKIYCDKKADSEEAILIKSTDVFDLVKVNVKKAMNNDVEELVKYMELLKQRMKYTTLYCVNPVERMAEINSCQTIIDMLKPEKETYPNLFEFSTAIKVETMLSGYEESWKTGRLCPTEVFLEATDNIETWYNFDFFTPDYDEMTENAQEMYDLKRRLTLGFPVSESEFYRTVNWLENTNKYKM